MGTLDIKAISNGGKYSLADLGSELAMAARELAEYLEDNPKTEICLCGLRRRAEVFGQAAEFIKRVRVMA